MSYPICTSSSTCLFPKVRVKREKKGGYFGTPGYIFVLSSVLDKLNAEDQIGKPRIPRVPVLHNCRGHCSEKDTVEYNLKFSMLSPAFACL